MGDQTRGLQEVAQGGRDILERCCKTCVPYERSSTEVRSGNIAKMDPNLEHAMLMLQGSDAAFCS